METIRRRKPPHRIPQSRGALIFQLLPFVALKRRADKEYNGGPAHRALAAGLAEIAGAAPKEMLS